MEIEYNKNQKYHYYRISGLADNWEWCYSASKLEKKLNRLTKGLVLNNLYVYLDSFLDRRGDNWECLDLSCVGGYVLLVFNKLAIAFALHVEGMVEYSIFSPSKLHIEEKYDYMPDRYDPTYADLIELKDYFEKGYSGKRIIRAEVKHTDVWGFRLEGFDVECAKKAADANDLPERIVFHLSNDVQLKLICDDLEYCYIIVEKVNPLN